MLSNELPRRGVLIFEVAGVSLCRVKDYEGLGGQGELRGAYHCREKPVEGEKFETGGLDV